MWPARLHLICLPPSWARTKVVALRLTPQPQRLSPLPSPSPSPSITPNLLWPPSWPYPGPGVIYPCKMDRETGVHWGQHSPRRIHAKLWPRSRPCPPNLGGPGEGRGSKNFCTLSEGGQEARTTWTVPKEAKALQTPPDTASVKGCGSRFESFHVTEQSTPGLCVSGFVSLKQTLQRSLMFLLADFPHPPPPHDIDFFLRPPLPSESPPSPLLAGAAALHHGGVRKAN